MKNELKMDQIRETLGDYEDILKGLDDDIDMASYIRYKMYEFISEVQETIRKMDENEYKRILSEGRIVLDEFNKIYELAQPTEYDGRTMKIIGRWFGE